MRIPPEKVEEVRQASDILEVVGDYVKLKKRGSNYFGLSPFKQEKTPSFSVHPGKGIFKCFATGIGGDVFSFLRQMEGVEFYEAVRVLADRYNVALPEEEPGAQEKANEQEGIYAALRFAGRYYYTTLTQEAAGRKGLAYLEGRGFTPKTIKHFGLGYAPDAWDALVNAAEAAHVSPETLEKAGLVIPRKDGSGHYDRYRGRVLFPIFSHLGKVVGFGGRILDAASDQPKYINSPETQVYSKSRVLYGLFQGRQEIRREEEVFLVEGYTDVVSLHQAGVENAVATCGTALTPEQVRLLSRYTRRIVLLYDADAAGASAAARGIDTVLENWNVDEGEVQRALSEGFAVYAVMLPQGEDPDSFVKREGGEAFRAYVRKHRQDFVAFRYELARRAGQLDTPEGTVAAQQEALQSIALLPSPLLREQYLRRAAETFGVPDIHLHEAFAALMREKQRREDRDARFASRREVAAQPSEEAAVPAAPEVAPPAHVLPEEQVLLRVMLERGAEMVEFILGHMGLDEFTEGPPREMAERLLEQYQNGRVVPTAFLSGEFGAAIQRLATDALADVHTLSENWERKRNIVVPGLNEDAHEAAASAMTLLKLDRLDEAITAQRRRVHAADHGEGDSTEALYRLTRLQQLRKQIEARAFLNGG